MGEIKKNKIHNPQIITDPVPAQITDNDVGRIWVDNNNMMKIALKNKDTGIPEFRNLLDTSDVDTFNGDYFKEIKSEYLQVELQGPGDKHFDNGYDFFSDPVYLKNTNQEIDDYYSFFYIEVSSTSDTGYLRTITDINSTNKHIRTATGNDTYSYNSNTYKVVNYSKIILPETVKGVVSIKFDNKDEIEYGFELQEDAKTILIYIDPDGYFVGRNVKVTYIR